MRFTRGFSLAGLVLWCGFAAAQMPPQLGPAPEVADPEQRRVSRPAPRGGLVVDTANRAAVAAFYHSDYVPDVSVPIGWTGNGASCAAGTTSAAFQNAIARRINWFRAMAGLQAGVTLDSALHLKCQQAALMMGVEGDLDHFPGTNWACYSADGREAAGRSNLALGANGARAITLYMDDPGSNNQPVGHRRWILFPPTVAMGTGDVGGSGASSANALWVIGNTGPRNPNDPTFVAWPPRGYVPYQVLSRRWSVTARGANFSNATVQMNRDGASVDAPIVARNGGYGDPALVWEPANLSLSAPATDAAYTVTVQGVMMGGVSTGLTYQVVIFDPGSGSSGAGGSSGSGSSGGGVTSGGSAGGSSAGGSGGASGTGTGGGTGTQPGLDWKVVVKRPKGEAAVRFEGPRLMKRVKGRIEEIDAPFQTEIRVAGALWASNSNGGSLTEWQEADRLTLVGKKGKAKFVFSTLAAPGSDGPGTGAHFEVWIRAGSNGSPATTEIHRLPLRVK